MLMTKGILERINLLGVFLSVPFFEGGMGIGAVEVFLAVFHLLQLNVLGIL